ncbi:MAG: tetratricopeptide repeat protein [Burkholderiales bacterium]
MNKTIGSRFLSWILVVLLAFQGCAQVRPRMSEEAKADVGTIGVAAARFDPSMLIGGPTPKKGLSVGAVVGGLAAGGAFAATCNWPGTFGLCPIGTIAFAVLGALVGALAGAVTESQVTKKEMLEATGIDLHELRVQENLRKEVIQYGKQKTSHTFVALPDVGPISTVDEPNYSSLAGRKIDTVLEVSALSIGTTEDKTSTQVALTVKARSRFVRVRDNAVLLDRTYDFRGDTHHIDAWKEPGSGVFRTALDQAYRSLAEQIVGELMLSSQQGMIRQTTPAPTAISAASTPKGESVTAKEQPIQDKFFPAKNENAAPNDSSNVQLSMSFQNGVNAYGRKDYTTALGIFRGLADQGDARAQTNLGLMYQRGEGVARDDAEAVKWYRKAADQGFVTAQFNLGYMYSKGIGVANDDTKAVKWYRKAADQGHASAQFNLGRKYAQGEGVTKDQSEAVKWFHKAADQGYAPAQETLRQPGGQ